MTRAFIFQSIFLAITAVNCQSRNALADEGADPSTPVVFTAQEDHQAMMKVLEIKKLRPGPSGDEKAPNHANYDESLANPFPELPDPLQLSDGDKVTTADAWWKIRRPEIVEAFESEVFGRIPTDVPSVRWEVSETREAKIGDVEAIEKQLIGIVDNTACPSIDVKISMSLTVPKDAAGPVPVLMMFGRTPFEPLPPWMRGRAGAPTTPGATSREGMLLAGGWGYAMLNPGSVQDDAGGLRQRNEGNVEPVKQGGGLTRGIIGLSNHGQARKAEDWGALRAWGWGASRGLDYLETDSSVDKSRVGIEGVSRYGKAALVTMAFDQRFAVALIGSSGKGGTTLYRRNFGEAVESLTSSGEYHWMAGNFLKYGTEDSSFGSKNASAMPVDSHQLIALCAPRPVFISYGIPEQGDAKWLDQQGSFMATIAAQSVYRLLGAKDLGRSDDFKSEKMPAVNEDLLEGELAWRQHDGGHTDAPNIEHFLRWTKKKLPSRATEASSR